MKCRTLDSLMAAMAAAIYFAVVLPLQSYLANAESFTYGLSSLVAECAVAGAILLVLATAVNYCCTPRLGKVTHLAMLVAVVLVMLESGPLSIGLPELNGEFEGYRSVGRTVLDYSVLTAVLALPWIFYRKIAPFIAWISVAVAVYSAATVFDVKRAEKVEAEGVNPALLVPRDVVVDSAEFSAEDNVIVLVLDATSQFVVQDIFQDSALAKRYDGFVNYVNNVGMHWNTSVGMPGLMTGKYYESALELPRYGKSSYGKESFANGYLEKDIPVYVNVGPGRSGCCNRPVHGGAQSQRSDGRVLTRPMFGQFELSLVQLCVFRLLPYGLKEGYLQRFIRQRSAATDAYVKWRFEPNLYPRFAAKGVSKTARRTLHVHHTESGHPPIVFDENGKSIVCKRPGYAEYRGQCRNALKCAAELFEVWKTNGVYDASTIIMAADHSAAATFNTPGVDLHGADPHSFPFLMVKPKGARGAYCESELPTSHCRIADVVRALADRPLNRPDIESLLVQTNRLVRLAQSGSIVDWTITPDRKVKKTVRPDQEPNVKDLKPLAPGVKYSFRIDSGSGAYPDFVVENGNRNVTTGLAVHKNPMRFRFRVDTPASTYRLEFSGKARATHFPTNRLVAACGGTTNTLVASTYDLRSFETTFDAVAPDADGVVECVFSCDDIGYANYVLSGVKIGVNGESNGLGKSAQPVRRGPVEHGILCLSFDDGRSVKSWVENLPLFAKYGARCSFFPNGAIGTNRLAQCLKLHAAGHDVGLHTFNHKRTIELLKEIGGEAYMGQEVEPQRKVLVEGGIPVKSFSYPFNHRSPATDEFLLAHGFKRLRASVGDYSKMLKAGVAQVDMNGGFTNASAFADVKVVRAFPISTNMVEMLRVLDRAAGRNEFVGMYSHAISAEHSNDVPRENLEAILKHARELGMEFRTLAD